jgi:integrase
LRELFGVRVSVGLPHANDPCFRARTGENNTCTDPHAKGKTMAPDWKKALGSILAEHNHRHGKRDKDVSALTREQRGARLFHCFCELHALGYQLDDPRNLGHRHIQALVDAWLAAGKSAATIQVKLSHLRVFATWVGKPGLVRAPGHYVRDAARVKRTYAAQRDASWSTQKVDPVGVILTVRAIDPFVANQLLAEFAFGLRVKEAVMLRPWRADQGGALAVSDGTKGGRPRLVPLRDQQQRCVLDHLKRCVKHKNQSLADPVLTLKQAMTRYYSVMRAAQINRKGLGVTSHGLRKEFTTRLYRELTGVAPPIQGGQPIDRLIDREARLQIVEHVGHTREQIGTAYLGSLASLRSKARKSIDTPEA